LVARRASKHDARPDVGLVITCEHGGNRIPARYRDLFKAEQALLDSHRGYDPGALRMARTLSDAFSAPLIAATVSRLLVDLNRSIGHRHLHGEAVQKMPLVDRQYILQRFYRPYREQAERLVLKSIAETGRVIHISAHSFVPELDGKRRGADIGLLYDPARAGEVELCASWKARLRSLAPEVTVRRNYPYAGKSDGLTAWFRRQLPASEYVGVELEVNQSHAASAGLHWRPLRTLIVEALRGALDRSDL
jgi:predicted N-formylglutamate amidohydrolase